MCLGKREAPPDMDNFRYEGHREVTQVKATNRVNYNPLETKYCVAEDGDLQRQSK